MNEGIPATIFQQIRRIQMHMSRYVQGALAGSYLSAFRGRGIEFEEVRPYLEGDEVRTIDWNVSARLHAPYVKVFQEERELTLLLLVDRSASMVNGPGGNRKKETLAQVAGTLALSALENGDRVGWILFTEKVEKYVPPTQGRNQAIRMIRDILYEKPLGKKTDIGSALTYARKVERQPVLCFLLSDFFCSDFSQSLKQTVQRHECISMGIYDSLEINFPSLGMVAMEDAESGYQRVVDTGDRSVVHVARENMDHFRQEYRKLCRQLRIDYIEIPTDKPLIPILQHFFHRRATRGFR